MTTTAHRGRATTRPQSPAGFAFPETAALQRALSASLSGVAVEGLAVIAREPSIYATTFPSEIVTCTVEGGGTVKLHCKYGRASADECDGDRRGVSYEGRVYYDVLRHLRPPTAAYHGLSIDEAADRVVLFLEYISDAVRVNSTPDPDALPLAARWIGEFHRHAEAWLMEADVPFLTRFDEAYFLGCVERTLRFATPLHGQFPWLPDVCAGARMFFEHLVRDRTVIHGEYYTQNIVYRAGTVFPVDWESAGIGAGLTDLAALAIGWPDDVVQRCERGYCEARWPSGCPADFDRMLDAARVHLMFRCLGDRPEWTTQSQALWRFHYLADAGRRWGLI